MAESFKLPASSMEELLKIIQAYANEKEGAILSLDDIVKSTGIARTSISANNGFLVQIGLITEGNKKSTTEIGRSLGRAYISKQDDEIERIWKEVVAENDFLNRMISAVRIRNGMDRSSFLNHIIYSSGQKDTKQNRTGAGAIIEIMKAVHILSETDGKLTIIETSETEKITNPTHVVAQPATTETIPNNFNFSLPTQTGNSIAININIDCSVADLDSLAEKLNNLLNSLSQQS